MKLREYGTRPDFCEGADPQSKGIVENLVGYVKSDLMIPQELSVSDLADANAKAAAWCAELNEAELVVNVVRLDHRSDVYRPR